ncbi:putative methyltransferase-domain-containing protein [Pilobolus umbonatus]|nr:putative methyltransferase-domain-containing protein [Pilobolus umbonatus]
MSLTDEEFRVKIDKHFSLYRINLRSPIASKVIPNKWYRVDLLLVNEVGLFRRSDIEPDGLVEVKCELLRPTSDKGFTPLDYNDNNWEIEIRPTHSFKEGQLSSDIMPTPGFHREGRGAFEYRVIPKNPITEDEVRYLCISPKRFYHFPKEEKGLDIMLPLVVGPIQVCPQSTTTEDTRLPLELWAMGNRDMVYDGYRIFSHDKQSPANIVIHEMWDSGIPGKIWDSALIMLDFMKNIIQYHPEYIDGKHTVDLSAGTGLLGLYIANIMASKDTSIKKGRITITELDEALALIVNNIAANEFLTTHNTLCELRPMPLLWGIKNDADQCGKADLIIASDVLYESEFFDDLVKTFVDLSHSSTRIYIGYKRRGFDTTEEKKFWSLCETHFKVTLLRHGNNSDTDDALVPPMSIDTKVQLYRLLPL